MNPKNEYLEDLREVAFNYLQKTNRFLLVADKNDQFLHSFTERYRVCHMLLVGSVFDDIPWRARIFYN